MTAESDPLFPQGHPVVTPVGDGRIERSWAEGGQRMALVRLDSGERWEGPEEELGDGTIDPNALCQYYGICDNPAIGERWSPVFQTVLPICAEHERLADEREGEGA
jgi:hypothetical protein